MRGRHRDEQRECVIDKGGERLEARRSVGWFVNKKKNWMRAMVERNGKSSLGENQQTKKKNWDAGHGGEEREIFSG